MQNHDTPTSDGCTQAQRLQHAEALFAAIMKLVDEDTSAFQLARLGALTTGKAADEIVTAQEVTQ